MFIKERKKFCDIEDPSSIDFSNGEWSWGGFSGPELGEDKCVLYRTVRGKHSWDELETIAYELPKWMIEITTSIRDRDVETLKHELRELDKRRSYLLEPL